MAETTTKTTTTPRARSTATKRPATKTTAAKATTAKAAPATEEPEGEDVTRVAFTLAHSEDTKSFAKFNLKEDVNGNATGCVGSVYAPLGTQSVRVQLIGPANVVEPD